MSSKAGQRAQQKREAKRARRAAAVGLLTVGTGVPLGAAVIVAPAAEAATLNVTNNNDSGAGSLRAAVAASNASTGVTDTINVTTTGTITLTSGEIEITDDVTITGPGAAQLTVSAGGDSRVFNIHPATAYESESVVISGLTLANGSAPTNQYYYNGNTYEYQEPGGVINADNGYYASTNSSLTLQAVTITGGDAGNGGGVRVGDVDFTVTDSTVSNNTALRGGGISARWGSTVLLDGATISGNTVTSSGGGLNLSGADATVLDTTIQNNEAGWGGGLIASGQVAVDGSIVSGNTAGSAGGLLLYGLYGGGSVSNTLISGNSATYALYGGGQGGGVQASASSSSAIGFDNVTIVGNTATGYGGGLTTSGTVVVSNSTVSNNSAQHGGGVLSYGDATTVRNSIVANNSATTNADKDIAIGSTLYDGPVNLDYSLVESTPAVGATTAVTPGSNIIGQDPQLGALASNGGPTQTMKPALASPVIDKGKSFGEFHDQRGRNRPVDLTTANAAGGDGADMGAVELSSDTDTPPANTVQNTTPPTVPTAAVVGSQLTATNGTWSTVGLTFAYQWYRGAVTIDGATSQSYTPVAADVGYRLSVRVTGLKDGYTSTTVASNLTDATDDGVPDVQNTSSPTIPTTAQIGVPLTVSNGTWTPSGLTFTYQWLRDGDPILGATASSYTPVAADDGLSLAVQVTGSKVGYDSATAWSNWTDPVDNGVPNVQNTSSPTIPTTAQIGVPLTVSNGTWTPSGLTFTYQWLRDGDPIPGATGSSYTPVAADVGYPLAVQVTGSKVGYDSAIAWSNWTNPVSSLGNVQNSTPPSIPTAAQVGVQLTASPGTWTPIGVTFTYQWYRDALVIVGATGQSYTPVAGDVGHQLHVRVTASKAGYNPAMVSSNSTSAVVGAPSAPIVTPGTLVTSGTGSITGKLKVGKKVKAAPPSCTPAASVSYQWLRGHKAIANATKAKYKLKSADKGKKISVRVTYTLPGYNATVVTIKHAGKVK